MSRPITQEEYLRRAKAVHGERYDYSQCVYVTQQVPVTIVCRKHGPFSMRPTCHTYHEQGCPKCGRESSAKSRTYTQQEFVDRSRARHGDKYDYSQVEYKGGETYVNIVCPEHGIFPQTPFAHILGGRGCPRCAIERRHGFTRERFARHCEIKKCDALLYLIEVFNETERFLKIGLTSMSIQDRFGSFRYEFREIAFLRGSPRYIWDLEKSLHTMCREFEYRPKHRFKGHTECYRFDALNTIRSLWLDKCKPIDSTPNAAPIKENRETREKS